MLLKSSIFLSLSLMSSSLIIYSTYPIIEEQTISGEVNKEPNVEDIDFKVFHLVQRNMDTLAEIQGIEPFDLQIDKIESIKDAKNVEEALEIYGDVMYNFGLNNNKNTP